MEEAPEDVEALRKLVKGLRLAARPDEARSVIRAGLFRNPRHPRFRRLWQSYQFQALRRQQQSGLRAKRTVLAGEPVLLPFRRPEGQAPAAPLPETLRLDGPAVVGPPHGPRFLRRPEQRHVQ